MSALGLTASGWLLRLEVLAAVTARLVSVRWLPFRRLTGAGPYVAFAVAPRVGDRLVGAWTGERPVDTGRWLIMCVSMDALIGAGAVALAAVPLVTSEVLAVAMDAGALTRSTARQPRWSVP